MGTWTPLKNKPSANISTMLLLADGTVFCSDSGSPRWFRLTPDNKGSYINGTWSQLADGPTAPLYFASDVLTNGRVFVAGGEYQDGMQWDILAAQVYNPGSDVWSIADVPPGWPNLGDAPSCMLPDGRILVGSINTNHAAIYDPNNNTWTPAADKVNPSSSEETWTLLPDETILAVECDGHPNAEKYVIAADEWIPIDPTPTDLVEASSIEIGPAILLPDGRVFCTGATGHTALYNPPPIANQRGSWTAGPDFPPQPGHPVIGAKDAPASLLPNGKVLCIAGPVDGVGDNYLPPMFFFEFDPGPDTFALIAGPSTNPGNLPPFVARFLVVPSGEVLFSNGTDTVSVYQPGGAAPSSTWLPTIIRIEDSTGASVTTVPRGETLKLVGRQLNGLSQANSYGDDAQMATNYPLVRIRHNGSGDIVYCPTGGHSSMGVATGSAVHSTQFDVPGTIGTGASTLEVVANGIASSPHAVTVA
jgi:hypothetical protein